MSAARRCQSRSPYGNCGRSGKHDGPHAVPIGDGVWFGYERGGIPLGYGYLDGDAFKPLPRFAGAVAGAAKSPAGGGVIRGPGVYDDYIGFPLETGFLLRAKQPACNVAGCDHTKPDECRIDRCATCNEPYDGTEPPDRHIARAHVEAMARERRTFRRPS